MHACLVILLVVMSVGPLAGIQWDLGRILQTFYGSKPGKLLEDAPFCGELGDLDTLRKKEARKNERNDNCLWDCSWDTNPYYKYYFPWTLISAYTPPTGDQCKIVRQILIFITAPRIPTDLKCLQDCFPPKQLKLMKKALKDGKKNRQAKLEPCAGNFTYWFPESLDPKLDILIGKSSALRTRSQNNDILSNDLAEEFLEDNEFFSLLFSSSPDAKFSNDYQSFVRATNSFELSLEICAFARFFNELNQYGKSRSYNLFGNKTCDDFLPQSSKSRQNKRVSKINTKTFGSTTSNTTVNRYPWLCSLKESGFRGRHRCGVTLLAGPPEPILVSAAHCNYVCKDNTTMQVQEICCCRAETDQASCRQDSSYCTPNAQLTAALPNELQIVCGEHSLAEQPEKVSLENEVVLKIREIVNHEGYREGPYFGKDIAIYKVEVSNFYDEKDESKLKRGELYPACLPKPKYTDEAGIFAAWVDAEPIYRVNDRKRIRQYTQNYLYPRQVQMEEVVCKDPDWMQSNSYFPPGTVCYRDPSLASCVLFGNSGAGVVRKFDIGVEKFSWIGTLSMHKGCDMSWIVENSITYAAENPRVFTDAYCYLDWIAKQYGMALPDSYKKPESCKVSMGDITDINKSFCRANGHIFGINTANPLSENTNTYCNFGQLDEEGKPFDKCRLLAEEGFAYNLFQCKDGRGQNVTCANNCRGVDPNAVIVGGTALLAATATVGLGSLLTPVIGLGGLFLAGGTVANGMCPIGSCNVRGRCCLLQFVRRRLRCPRRC